MTVLFVKDIVKHGNILQQSNKQEAINLRIVSGVLMSEMSKMLLKHEHFQKKNLLKCWQSGNIMKIVY